MSHSHLRFPRKTSSTSSLVYGPAMDTVGATETLTWPNSHISVLIKSTATKTRLGLVVKTFVFHSNVSQRLGLPRLSQRFNVQLVQLHGGISVFFFFFFFPLVVQTIRLSFVFGHNSTCGPPSGFCSSLRQEGPKAVTEAHLLA